MREKKHAVKGKKILSMVLCIGALAVTCGIGQASFYVVPVVRDSSSSTPCANDGYEVLSDTGRCWMAFNLGATEVATLSNYEAAYGDLYQWGRRVDGHERRDLDPTTETTTIQSVTDNPGHGSFIKGSQDWRSPHNNFLWQGISGINNPCPQGFRLPTEAEWQAEVDQYVTSTNTSIMELYESPLKLVPAGYRGSMDGEIHDAGSFGVYLSSTAVDGSPTARTLMFPDHIGPTFINTSNRANGGSIRCIKD